MADFQMLNEFRVGHVLSRASSILTKNFVPFMILTGIVYSPLIIATIVVMGRAAEGGIDEQGALIFAVSVGFGAFLLNLMASAAVMYGVIQQLRGQHASMGACIAVGLKRLLPVLGTGILMSICIVAGFVALIIPGVVLTMMFYVAVPATVIEHQGPVEALKRSKALTDGHKVSIFGLNFLVGLIGVGLGLIVGIIQAAMPEGVGLVVNLASDVFIGALGAVVTAVTYHDLRALKEGVNVDDLVRVFE